MTEADKVEFDLSMIEAEDTATLAIKFNKKPTTWVWTFCGPGHPKTIALAHKVSKRLLDEQRDQLQAQINQKKYKVEEQTLDEIRTEMVSNIVARTESFTPVKLRGEVIQYSPENARRLLLDPRMGELFTQVNDFLKEEANFIKASAKGSTSSPSDSSSSTDATKKDSPSETS